MASSDDLQVHHGVRIRGSEISFRFMRSGGPGGQNVNKVSTRVELLFDVAHSASLSSDQREKVTAALAARIDRTGVLRIVVDESRSQWTNRTLALDRLAVLLAQALRPVRKRVPSAPTRASRQRREAGKKTRSRVKSRRRKVQPED